MFFKDPHVELLRLANFLDDLPHSKFHIPEWSSSNATKHSCGTAGCVCGWAATLYSQFWSFSNNAKPSLLQTNNESTITDFAEFYDLPNKVAADIIFMSLCSSGSYYIDELEKQGFYYNENFSTEEEFLEVYADQITPFMAANVIRKYMKELDPRAFNRLEKANLENLKIPTETPSEVYSETLV